MKKDKNLLNRIPERIREHIRREDNTISVLLPRFTWGPFKKYLLPLLKNPTLKVHLDEMGTCVWEHIDGKSTVLEISHQVCLQKQAEENNEWHQRIALFMRMLEAQDLIRLR